MLKKFVTILGGDPNRRALDKLSDTVQQINALEPEFELLSDEALGEKTNEFRIRYKGGETLDELLPEAFAAVREASKRTIGLRHFDVQLVGGGALHQGIIAEMRTGEGKTLVATLPLYLNALTGRGVHLITVNDYLARRDARWMAPIYTMLGMTTGVLQMAARTENGKKAFIIDLERESPHEDQHQLRMVPRAEAYAADITYGTNSEFGFDYLRDNMTMSLADRVQRGHYYAIVDEVDNVLIDEARTPLIISGPAHDDTEWYVKMAQVIRQLRPEDYEVSERDRNVTLSEIGEAHVEELLGFTLRDPDRPEDVSPEQARLMGYLEQALRAQFLFRRNKDYLVQAGKVIIIDEFTGRLMPGRRWSDGLHQAVEAKEGARVQAENVTYATITIQNYFRMYEKLAGMSGTSVTEAEEFHKIYKLEVLAIPTNLEYQAAMPSSGLQLLENRDEGGYKYRYYSRKEDPQKKPVFWQRKDYPDIIYRSEEAKFRALTQEILRYHVLGRPLLIGTTSVELSEKLSSRLRSEPLRRLAQVMILRNTWLEKNNRIEDGRLISELEHLNGPLDTLQVPDLRKMSRELDIAFNPEESANLVRLLKIMKLSDVDKERLTASLEAGIPHQVLNARKHTEESQIIAGAGSFGAVTIATNMAGRGVDIKLGGELPDDVIESANRILRRAGYADPYDMTMEERRQAFLSLSSDQFGIYGEQVERFLTYLQNMERVKDLGGLHVIGSERHEARRIDNQLRGRSARQGDPGSSRFYLSLEDELMRRFGGEQVDSLMKRMKIDDAVPMEMGVVSRLVEQSQTRVEGSNFDVRKHLLEYDDVLNSQRSRIYAQRDRIFTKEDLHEDVTEMLRSEVNRRVPEALGDEEGPWKLLAWLDQIQPPISLNGNLLPSYTLHVLLDDIIRGHPTFKNLAEVKEALLLVAENALKAEEDHLMHAVYIMLDNTRERIESQRQERIDSLDTYFEGLKLGDEESAQKSPREIVDEISSLVHAPLRLSPEEQRKLRDHSDEVYPAIRSQVETIVSNQAMLRLIGGIERRLDEDLGINSAQLSVSDWKTFEDQLTNAVQLLLSHRRERLLGDADGGQIGRDLEANLDKIQGPLTSHHLAVLLYMLPQGTRSGFDKKTHRRIVQRTTRLTYFYYTAHLLEKRETEEITEDVLNHLEQAHTAICRAWGFSEFARLANSSLFDLDPLTQAAVRRALGDQQYQWVEKQPLQSLDRESIENVAIELGKRALTEIYRQLLLSVISELWVDYLTQMEALRVSIGLEAYAQRDPLVQYKSRASDLFQGLLSDMRTGVINRMFTYRPRDMSRLQTAVHRESVEIHTKEMEDEPVPPSLPSDFTTVDEEVLTSDTQAEQEPSSSSQPMTRSQKRRRHRH